jgi:Xaa-Pro aminopeptidase
MDLDAIQLALKAQQLDGWLFYDHHRRDPIAYRILGLPEGQMASRRWYYYIPAAGEPRKLAHRIESAALDSLPGSRALYSQWSELGGRLKELLGGKAAPRVAMQYSPGCELPAISMADAGTVEQVRALGCEVVSSADLISRFDAAWTAAMLASHRRAGKVIDATIRAAFAHVRAALVAQRPISEYELQQWMAERMRTGGLAVAGAGEEPIVAVNAHAGDPHYQPQAQGSEAITAGSLLLLDVWGREAKVPRADSAYYDVTWVGYCLRGGETAPPEAMAAVFGVVRDAREAGIKFVEEAVGAGRILRGFEVDQQVRGVIEAAGLGKFFVHRTGHSLGRDVHSSGANLDDFETHDVRQILPHSAFTIEPGVYGPQQQPFGVRSEVNVYVGEGTVEVTAPRQAEIVRI